MVDWLWIILHLNVFNHLKSKSLSTVDSNKIKMVSEVRKRGHFKQVSMAPDDTERQSEKKVFYFGVKGGIKTQSWKGLPERARRKKLPCKRICNVDFLLFQCITSKYVHLDNTILINNLYLFLSLQYHYLQPHVIRVHTDMHTPTAKLRS